MPGGVIYRFGPFELNTSSRVLLREGAPVALADRHLSVLSLLLARAGAIVTKEQLMDAVWSDAFVGDNSLQKVMSDLRQQLGDMPGGRPYAETIRRKGYRFAGQFTRKETGDEGAALDARLTPHRRWIEGRAALETLKIEQVRHARGELEAVVRSLPRDAPAHVGLANACVMQFEATRADAEPDRAAPAAAVRHAKEACDLDPQYGDAWATLGFVLARAATPVEALSASRQATMIEPDNWRHQFRLASVAWGEERLRAARRTLARVADFPLAHFLAATVFVARQKRDDAEREVVAGIAGHERQRLGGAPFSGVALDYVYGLLRLARGDAAGALASFERELSFEGDGHIYARECAALARVSAHPLAHAGLRIARRRMGGAAPDVALSPVAFRGAAVDVAMARAALLIDDGDAGQAAAIVAEALVDRDAGSAGWILPIEPLLGVARAPAIWTPALARLMGRAL